jgi:S1-C subfamily serine protease
VTVADRGAAAAAGLSRGDLIVAIDGEPARDVALLTRRFRAADQGSAILLTIERDQQHRVLALEKR